VSRFNRLAVAGVLRSMAERVEAGSVGALTLRQVTVLRVGGGLVDAVVEVRLPAGVVDDGR